VQQQQQAAPPLPPPPPAAGTWSWAFNVSRPAMEACIRKVSAEPFWQEVQATYNGCVCCPAGFGQANQPLLALLAWQQLDVLTLLA